MCEISHTYDGEKEIDFIKRSKANLSQQTKVKSHLSEILTEESLPSSDSGDNFDISKERPPSEDTTDHSGSEEVGDSQSLSRRARDAAEHPVYLTPDYSSIRDPLGQDTEEEEEDEREEEGDEEEDDDQVYEEDEDWQHEADSLKAMFETEFTKLRDRQRWCRAFYDHLQGLDGKTLSERNANQHTMQVFPILDSIDPRSDTLAQRKRIKDLGRVG